jgi:hypothetical protein
MTVEVKGLVHVYGPPGAGKTFFALTAGTDPNKICFLDGDASKGKHIAEQIGIPKSNYHDLTSMGQGLTEVQYYIKFMAMANKLSDTFEVLIWDNPIELFKAAHSYVATHRLEWREKWAAQGAIAGPQEWIITRQVLMPRLYSLLQTKAQLVILCTHEKPQRDDSQVKTGYMEPNADPSLRTEAGMVVRLARNMQKPNDPAPVGLVIKNIGTVNVKERSITRILPDRIEPCTWLKIEEYIKNPVGNRDLEPSEIPNEFEVNLIEGTLNPEQRELYDFRRKMALIRADESLSDDVISAAANNANLPPAVLPNKIVADLSEIHSGLTTDKVRDILDSMVQEESEQEESGDE